MDNGASFFGEKVMGLVQNAQDVAKHFNFEGKVEDTISDMWSIIDISLDSVVSACESHEEDNHFDKPPTPEHTDLDTPAEIREISVDELIAESYSYGKSDEEIAKEFKDDLKGTVRQYGWLLVALGIALDNEEKKDLVLLLRDRTDKLQEQLKELKKLENKIKKGA